MAVVDKRRGESFTVTATFQNGGDAPGTWTVNAIFRGDWSWDGTPVSLTLNPGESKTITWTGTVPNVSSCLSSQLYITADSGSYPQDWWIHVIGEALLIVSSRVS